MTEQRFELGDACPDCGARIGVLNSIPTEDLRVRYIGCKQCLWRPADNKRTVPLGHAPRQRPRMRRLRMRRL
jgi:hypothetical protein